MTDLPKYTEFFSTVLTVLARTPTGMRRREIQHAAAKEARLTDEQMRLPMPNGRGLLYENRIGWAISYLGSAGLLVSPFRGTWRLSEEGARVVAKFPTGLPPVEVSRIDSQVRKEYRENRSQPGSDAEAANLSDSPTGRAPEEMIHASVKALEDVVAAELLKELAALTDQRFELVVLDVLRGVG